jgi:hypothetical protein
MDREDLLDSLWVQLDRAAEVEFVDIPQLEDIIVEEESDFEADNKSVERAVSVDKWPDMRGLLND